MFENILKFFKKAQKGKDVPTDSKSAAKERLHLVLMQDRANVSADFLDLMKQEIIEVIKKYIEVDESAIDVRLTNKENEDGTNGAPALYANIPILNIKNETRKVDNKQSEKKEDKKQENKETKSITENKTQEDKKQTENENKKENVKQEETKKDDNKKEEKEEVKPEENKEVKEEIKENKENKEDKKESKVKENKNNNTTENK